MLFPSQLLQTPRPRPSLGDTLLLCSPEALGQFIGGGGVGGGWGGGLQVLLPRERFNWDSTQEGHLRFQSCQVDP